MSSGEGAPALTPPEPLPVAIQGPGVCLSRLTLRLGARQSPRPRD